MPFCFLLLVLWSSPPPTDARLSQGIDAFYRTDWSRADSVFNRLQADLPDDPRAYFFSAMIPFWSYFFAGEDPAQARLFLQRSDRAIQVGQRRLESAPNDTSLVLLMSGLHGYRSLVAASEKEYRTAISGGVRGYGFTRQLLAYGSDRADALMGQGVFQYMIGSIPGEIRWMASLAGLSGNKAEGLRQLEAAARSRSDVRYDAMMVLSFLYEREKRPEQSLAHLNRFLASYPQNTVARYRQGRLLEELGRHDEALWAYRRVAESKPVEFAGIRAISRGRVASLASANLPTRSGIP